MNALVLLMILKLLVDQGHCEHITLISCYKDSEGIIKQMGIEYHIENISESELCSSNSTYKPVMLIRHCKTTTNYINSYILEIFQNCICSEFVTNTQDCSPSTMSMTTSAMSNNTSTQDHTDSMTLSTLSNNNQTTNPMQDINTSTIPIQNILIALLAISVALLLIVTAGWVCTCWAMHKSQKQEMSINTTNIR